MTGARDERARRLSAALRANLRKRKAQARTRTSEGDETDTAGPAAGEDDRSAVAGNPGDRSAD